MQILMLVNQVKEIYSIRLLLISAINSRQNVSKVKLTTSEIGIFPITLGKNLSLCYRKVEIKNNP